MYSHEEPDYRSAEQERLICCSLKSRLCPDAHRVLVLGNTKTKVCLVKFVDESMESFWSLRMPLIGNIRKKQDIIEEENFFESVLSGIMNGLSNSEVQSFLETMDGVLGVPIVESRKASTIVDKRFVMYNRSELESFSFLDSQMKVKREGMEVREIGGVRHQDEYERGDEIELSAYLYKPGDDIAEPSEEVPIENLHLANISGISNWLEEHKAIKKSNAADRKAAREERRLRESGEYEGSSNSTPLDSPHYDDTRDMDQQNQDFWDDI